MMKLFLLIPGLLLSLSTFAQSYRFDFTDSKNSKQENNYIKVSSKDTYTPEKGYGFDFQDGATSGANQPFFFSVNLPDGNYLVTAVIGNEKKASETTLRAESRRLFVENEPTKKGEFKTYKFAVNKYSNEIREGDSIKYIKGGSRNKLNWDNKLTLEFNGESPQLAYLEIERVDDIPTVFISGDSTVTDYDVEPYASWGQMIPRWFNDGIAFANYAESGARLDSFKERGRWEKILSEVKPGDWVFIEFGHNDQKLSGPGKGAFYFYMYQLKEYIDEVRSRGAYPVFLTPTRRRYFNDEGKLIDSHEDYPEAMRFIAQRENVPLIDLQEMTGTLYETLGVEDSKRAFVQYPAGTYPGQKDDLKDNTHFNPYGAYEIAKCVVEGIKQLDLPLTQYIREDYVTYDPAQPDSFASFKWIECPFIEITKPEGN
ncbi:MAG: rhamnogalacturonan acetylesterase [Muribaculaceae bacterium]|nr:rhamnogalacturonan acetylesterase [Muribaculaceae bacterium]